MKLRPAFVASLVTLAFASTNVAASSTDVAVTGTIVPGGCTPSLSAPMFQHGKIAARDLNGDQPTDLRDRSRLATLGISCEGPTLFGIRAVDNRADTVFQDSQSSRFGLGLTPEGEKIGAHTLAIVPAGSTIDGNPTFLALGNTTGSQWAAAEDRPRSLRHNGVMLGLVDSAGVTTGPVPVKEAVLNLRSALVIAPAEGLTLTSEVALDGAATLEVVYL